MSQGHKPQPEPALFIEAKDLYRHIPQGHFYARLAQVLDLVFVYRLTAPLYAARLGRPSLVGYQASARGGTVHVRLVGDRVKLGGHAVTVLRGDLLLPSADGGSR